MSTHNSTNANSVPSACTLSLSTTEIQGRAQWLWHAPSDQISDEIMPHQIADGPHSYLFVLTNHVAQERSQATAYKAVSRRYNFPIPDPTKGLLSTDEQLAISKAMYWQAKIANATKKIIHDYKLSVRGKQLRVWAVAQAQSAMADNVWIIIGDPPESRGFHVDGRSNLSLEEAESSVLRHTQVQSSQPSYSSALDATYDHSGPSQVNRPRSSSRMLLPKLPSTQAISSNQNFGSQSGHALAPNTYINLGRTSHPPSRSSFHTSVQQQTPYHLHYQPAGVLQLPRSLSGAADSNFANTQVVVAASQTSDFCDGLPDMGKPVYSAADSNSTYTQVAGAAWPTSGFHHGLPDEEPYILSPEEEAYSMKDLPHFPSTAD